MLTEEKVLESVEILTNCVLIKHRTLIKKDGKIIAESVERTSFMENQDFSRASEDILKYLKMVWPNRFSESGEILPFSNSQESI